MTWIIFYDWTFPGLHVKGSYSNFKYGTWNIVLCMECLFIKMCCSGFNNTVHFFSSFQFYVDLLDLLTCVMLWMPGSLWKKWKQHLICQLLPHSNTSALQVSYLLPYYVSSVISLGVCDLKTLLEKIRVLLLGRWFGGYWDVTYHGCCCLHKYLKVEDFTEIDFKKTAN